MSELDNLPPEKTICWIDERLQGVARIEDGHQIYPVNDKVSIEHAVDWISYLLNKEGFENIRVFAHGFYKEEKIGKIKLAYGGFGVQICDKGINMKTINYFKQWDNKNNNLKKIIFLSCGLANSFKLRNGMLGEGDRICQTLADITGADVYASNTSQEYEFDYYFKRNEGDPVSGKMDGYVYQHKNCRYYPIIMGRWEGRVYRYSRGKKRVDISVDVGASRIIDDPKEIAEILEEYRVTPPNYCSHTAND